MTDISAKPAQTPGQLFSHVYRERPKPEIDSLRGRRRIAGHVGAFEYYIRERIEDYLHREKGVTFGMLGKFGGLEAFFESGDSDEVLDAITLVARWFSLQNNQSDRASWRWIIDIKRIFQEENWQFRIDDRGGVHPLIDEAFEIERSSLLSGLAVAEYSAASASLRGAYDSLKPNGDGTLAAVRLSYDAIENVFKEKFGTSLLGATEIKKCVLPLVEQKYSGRAADSARLLADAFCKYVNAAHSYRHADKEKEPTPPPLEIAVLFLSQGTAFLRWLLEL